MNGQHFDAHLGKVVAHEDAQQALSQDLTAAVFDAVAAMVRRATMANFILSADPEKKTSACGHQP